MSIDIIKASIEDLDVLVDYQLKMAKETEELILDAEILRSGILAGLNDKYKAIYYIAKDGDKTVGSLMITKEWSDWRNIWVLWIQSVYVVEEMRGKGVYKALYSNIKEIAISENYGGIRLYVDKTNTVAQKVYSNLGMNGDHYQLFEYMP